MTTFLQCGAQLFHLLVHITLDSLLPYLGGRQNVHPWVVSHAVSKAHPWLHYGPHLNSVANLKQGSGELCNGIIQADLRQKSHKEGYKRQATHVHPSPPSHRLTRLLLRLTKSV